MQRDNQRTMSAHVGIGNRRRKIPEYLKAWYDPQRGKRSTKKPHLIPLVSEICLNKPVVKLSIKPTGYSYIKLCGLDYQLTWSLLKSGELSYIYGNQDFGVCIYNPSCRNGARPVRPRWATGTAAITAPPIQKGTHSPLSRDLTEDLIKPVHFNTPGQRSCSCQKFATSQLWHCPMSKHISGYWQAKFCWWVHIVLIGFPGSSTCACKTERVLGR